MTKDQLLDSFIETGDSVERFRELLRDMDAATYVVKVDTAELLLFSIDKVDEAADKINAKLYCYEQATTYKDPGDATLNLAACMEICGEAGYRELLTNTKFLLSHKGREDIMYFPSRSALYGLAARAELGGSGVFDSTHELFAHLARRYERSPSKAKLVVRKSGDLHKLVACMSHKYAYVPQSLLCEVMDTFEQDMGSKPVCTGWEITQFTTRLFLSFPEMADDFSRTYGLKDRITPGICLSTSDTGDGSFSAYGYTTIGRSRSRVAEYKRKHSGSIQAKDLQKSIKNAVFDRYTKLPGRLCELIAISVPNPREVTASVLDEIGFLDEIGKRTGSKLQEVLLSEYTPAVAYTAYDVAMKIMTLPERFVEGTESTLRKMESVVAKAAYVDYHRLIAEASAGEEPLLAA